MLRVIIFHGRKGSGPYGGVTAPFLSTYLLPNFLLAQYYPEDGVAKSTVISQLGLREKTSCFIPFFTVPGKGFGVISYGFGNGFTLGRYTFSKENEFCKLTELQSTYTHPLLSLFE